VCQELSFSGASDPSQSPKPTCREEGLHSTEVSVDSWEYLDNSPEPLEPQFADYDIEVMMVFTLAPGSINKTNKTLITYS